METENVNIITTFNFEEQNKNPKNGGLTLYQEVLAKNFQVIENLLKKLNQIYSHQQEYESSLALLNQKMQKLQIDNENIHHEFRTSHFMIDKKLNSIVNQYSNIVQDVVIIKKQLSLQNVCTNFPSSLQQQDKQICEPLKKNPKTSRLKPQKQKNKIKSSPQNFIQNKLKIGLNQEINGVNVKTLQEQNLGQFLSQIEKSKNKEIIELDQFEDQSQIQIKHASKQKIRKAKKRNVRPSIDSVEFQQNHLDSLQNCISQQFITQGSNSQKFRKIINEIGIDQYIKQQNVQIEQKVKSNQYKIQNFQKQMANKNQVMLIEVKSWNKQNFQQIESLKNFIQDFQKQQQNEFILIKKQIAQKISLDVFLSHIEILHKKIQITIKETFENFAQKKQTKRAIMFLQKKLNKIIQAQKRFNLQKSIQMLDNNTKCLSCNKSTTFQNYHPMFAQVHLTKNGQTQEKVNYEQNNSMLQFQKTQRYNFKGQQKNKNQNLTKDQIAENAESNFCCTSGFQKKGSYGSKYLQNFQKYNDLSQNIAKSGKFFKDFRKQKNQISLKTWKQKAGSILKKQPSSIHFRSKSTYKR